jgi:hypothetical protein
LSRDKTPAKAGMGQEALPCLWVKQIRLQLAWLEDELEQGRMYAGKRI